jgi:uncharacterized damage-inducible protein DinB
MSSTAIRLLSQYNTLANQRIINSCNKDLTLPSRHFDCLFFDSIHGTVNHIAGVTDLWLGRIFNNPTQAKKYHFLYNSAPPPSAQPPKTDGENWLSIEPDWNKSVKWLIEISQEAERLVCESEEGKSLLLAEGKLIQYSRTDGTVVEANSIHCLTHLFNHHTHHRGQIHAALCLAGIKDCVLDISAVVPEFAKLV